MKAILNNKTCVSISFFVLFGLLFCSRALIAPFWGGNDCWSNLLPILHFRQSILSNHTLPLYTDLWYGGRAQWQNPLWFFFYLPATFIWLIFPLDWGMRIIFTGHLIFSLFAGWKLGSLFLNHNSGRVAAAILFTSPMLPAMIPGHIEKVMAWGWMLLALYFLLDKNRPFFKRGLLSGICWGVVALTGANYYVFYVGLLLIPLVVSFKNRKLFLSFLSGSLVGLIHLPSVWYLIGVSRVFPNESIKRWSTDGLGLLTSLTIGLAKPMSWESWALVGIPVVYLFFRSLYFDIKKALSERTNPFSPQKTAVFISIVVLSLLATGVLYHGHHLFDPFRTAVRAISVFSISVTIFVLMRNPDCGKEYSRKKQSNYQWLLITSAVQVCIISWLIRPTGIWTSPYDPEAEKLAEILKDDNAKRVWFSMEELNDMYIDVVLTRYGISLPNVYYGDMGQTISYTGPYCGYSFDHLINLAPSNEEYVELTADVKPRVLGRIPRSLLQQIDQIKLYSKTYDIYRVTCDH